MIFFWNYFIIFVVTFLWNIQSFSSATSISETCTVCTSLYNRFIDGVDKTAKSNFAGGNTNWEEKSLGKYMNSETRLIEILEGVCDDKECHRFLEEHEDSIEGWWLKDYKGGDSITNLYDYLCINQSKVCCPDGTYGPKCVPCPGGSVAPCSSHGKCHTAGTREGNGTCTCNEGYEGDICDKCKINYIPDPYNVSNCEACHSACTEGCTGFNPENCTGSCSNGWENREQGGCQDVNECNSEDPCSDDDQYCTNVDGSFLCSKCDAACDGCTDYGAQHCKTCKPMHFTDSESRCVKCHESCKGGCSSAGPDGCESCADGWTLNSNICTDVNECENLDQCEVGKYCKNTNGSYMCNECDISCQSCTDKGNDKCTECKNGFKRDDSGFCTDIDECNSGEILCKTKNMKCINTPGAYECQCKKGYEKSGEECIKENVQIKQANNQKSVKKKKSKKSKMKIAQAETELYKYFICIFIYGVLGNILRNKLFFQTLLSSAFTVYVFQTSMLFDTLMSEISR